MKTVMHARKVVGCCLLVMATGAFAQTSDRSRIYSCVDGSGRTISSDRPIPECIDREQRILRGNTGHQQGVREPSYTQEEREKIEQEKKREQEAQRIARDKRQRDRVLLMRYPNETAHNAARADAKASVESVITAGQSRLEQLAQDKKKLEAELEFYENDLAKAPGALKRQFDSNQQDQEEQLRFIDGKRDEIKRVDQQFDSELAELKVLWGK